jgi:hypothetical protein
MTAPETMAVPAAMPAGSVQHRLGGDTVGRYLNGGGQWTEVVGDYLDGEAAGLGDFGRVQPQRFGEPMLVKGRRAQFGHDVPDGFEHVVGLGAEPGEDGRHFGVGGGACHSVGCRVDAHGQGRQPGPEAIVQFAAQPAALFFHGRDEFGAGPADRVGESCGVQRSGDRFSYRGQRAASRRGHRGRDSEGPQFDAVIGQWAFDLPRPRVRLAARHDPHRAQPQHILHRRHGEHGQRVRVLGHGEPAAHEGGGALRVTSGAEHRPLDDADNAGTDARKGQRGSGRRSGDRDTRLAPGDQPDHRGGGGEHHGEPDRDNPVSQGTCDSEIEVVEPVPGDGHQDTGRDPDRRYQSGGDGDRVATDRRGDQVKGEGHHQRRADGRQRQPLRAVTHPPAPGECENGQRGRRHQQQHQARCHGRHPPRQRRHPDRVIGTRTGAETGQRAGQERRSQSDQRNSRYRGARPPPACPVIRAAVGKQQRNQRQQRRAQAHSTASTHAAQPAAGVAGWLSAQRLAAPATAIAAAEASSNQPIGLPGSWAASAAPTVAGATTMTAPTAACHHG